MIRGAQRKSSAAVCGALLALCVVGAAPAVGASESTIYSLADAGTTHQLQGDYAGAKRVSEHLKGRYPSDPAGYTLNLNTLVGRLSWDVNDTRHDDEILTDADSVLKICRGMVASNPEDPRGYHVCGQAHFALTYLHAARGRYYRAGTNGSSTIANLETALSLDPGLVDAKLHLGAAHYFAHNLPPFVKAVSEYLWFIPSGDPAKGLPYLEAASQTGDRLADVAKFMYSTLLLDDAASDKSNAARVLRDLIARYPQSRRFHLRYIAHLVEAADYTGALQAADDFLEESPECCPPAPADRALGRLWKARAYLGQARIDRAATEIQRIPAAVVPSLPYWGRGWHALTSAQINDALNRRDQAVRDYRRVLALKSRGYVSPTLLEAAASGLR